MDYKAENLFENKETMNAAPTALLVYGASCYPTEMLCIPMGLRTCRPETGLVYASKLLTDINIISQ